MSTSTGYVVSVSDGDRSRGQQRMPVSVIVPLGRDGELAPACLRSVLSQEFTVAFEVIVAADVDNPAADWVERLFPSVRVVRHPVEVGPGGGRNYGIDQATGRYLAFIDTECIARRDWLARIVAACRANGGGPVCGWVESSNGWHGLASDMAERGIGRPNRPIAIPGIWGENMCISRRVLDSGAHFAEGVYGAEEVCLLETMKPPVHVMLDPSAVVLHLKQLRLAQSLQRMYELGRGSGIVRTRLAVGETLLGRCRYLLPLLPVGRLVATACRVSRCGIRQVLAFALLWPVVLCHLLWYTAGFAAGAFGRNEAGQHGTAQG